MWKVYRRQTTDDGRQVMAIVHLDLWSRWTNNGMTLFGFKTILHKKCRSGKNSEGPAENSWVLDLCLSSKMKTNFKKSDTTTSVDSRSYFNVPYNHVSGLQVPFQCPIQLCQWTPGPISMFHTTMLVDSRSHFNVPYNYVSGPQVPFQCPIQLCQ